MKKEIKDLPLADCRHCEYAIDRDNPRTTVWEYEECEMDDILDILQVHNGRIHCPEFMKVLPY